MKSPRPGTRGTVDRLLPATLLPLLCACSWHTGHPYNADKATQLVVGNTTTASARALMGAPFRAFPIASEPTARCANAAERWSYSYLASDKSSCATTLVFDEAGVLCEVTNGPAVGTKCHGEQ